MITQGISAFRNKRILLLQGPVGPFFRRLAEDLDNAGAQVFKVNFNGGDWFFYRQNSIAFRGGPKAWPAFFKDLLILLNIDTVMLFGDCRIYHAIAYDIARKQGLDVGVFEEGYVRPDYVTFENEGVNGYSPLPKNPIFYMNRTPSVARVKTDSVGNTFWYSAMWAVLYYTAAHLMRPIFPHYKHHRPLSVFEGLPWVRSLWRKAFYAVKEYGVQRKLLGPLSKKFFLVPLQVHNDSQIHVHSEFESIPEFIRHVVTSFAENAPEDAMLVMKHHPMDRGYCDYTKLISQLRKEFKLDRRLLYVHDLHLPSLLQHTRGVVLINSTVGLSALFHHAPLKVCGSSIYDIKGLVYQDALDSFWEEANPDMINMELFERFRSYIIEHTQLNGSFYKRLDIPASATGMRWGEHIPLYDEKEKEDSSADVAPDLRSTSARN